MATVIITQSTVIEAEFDDGLVGHEELRRILANFIATKIRNDMEGSCKNVISSRCEVRLKDEKPTVN